MNERHRLHLTQKWRTDDSKRVVNLSIDLSLFTEETFSFYSSIFITSRKYKMVFFIFIIHINTEKHKFIIQAHTHTNAHFMPRTHLNVFIENELKKKQKKKILFLFFCSSLIPCTTGGTYAQNGCDCITEFATKCAVSFYSLRPFPMSCRFIIFVFWCVVATGTDFNIRKETNIYTTP